LAHQQGIGPIACDLSSVDAAARAMPQQLQKKHLLFSMMLPPPFYCSGTVQALIRHKGRIPVIPCHLKRCTAGIAPL
jgi:hypothetical protein